MYGGRVGFYDDKILPRLVARAKAGRLRFVGDGENRIDTTYIENAAQAHFERLGCHRLFPFGADTVTVAGSTVMAFRRSALSGVIDSW